MADNEGDRLQSVIEVGGVTLENSANHDAVSKHVEIVVIPFPGGAAKCRSFRDSLRPALLQHMLSPGLFCCGRGTSA
jgi:hypothetical protein